MITEDNRLDRKVSEVIAATTTYTEPELQRYEVGLEDPDHNVLADQIDDVVSKLRKDETGRQAIAIADSDERCMVGVHVLVRDKIHVLSWLRASDIDEYRDADIGFLYWFGRKVRQELEIRKNVMVHVFTSSLHSEVN